MSAILAKLRAIAEALLVVFVAGVVAELIPGKDRLEIWIRQNETALLVALAAVAVVGLLVFMGSILSLLMDSDGSRGRRGRREVQGHDQFSFAELKGAFASGAAFRAPQWRRRLCTAFGAALMAVGVLGVVFVLAPVPIKLIVAAAFAYAVVRTVWAFWSVGVFPGA